VSLKPDSQNFVTFKSFAYLIIIIIIIMFIAVSKAANKCDMKLLNKIVDSGLLTHFLVYGRHLDVEDPNILTRPL
jgi:hypothetical protein